MPSDRSEVEAAVKRALAGQPGEWRVMLTEPLNASYWDVAITGPAGINWRRRFDGPDQQNPDFIENAVRSALDERVPSFAVIARKLDESWVQAKTCIVCGHSEWSISELPYVLQPLGGGSKIMPLYPVTCTNCGLTFLFNAIRAGLLPEGTA
jgi:hypothetical protein